MNCLLQWSYRAWRNPNSGIVTYRSPKAMADKDTRLLSSHPEAYLRAFERFLASCDQEGAI